MSTLMTEKKPESREHREALENVRRQVVAFGNQVHDYLDSIQADVEAYKFTVEKHGEGVEIEIEFKAYVHPKASAAAKIIPK